MISRFVKRFFKPLERFYKDYFVKPIKYRLQYEFARGYRYLLGMRGTTCFIGITGSCGKTTTTELVAAILAKTGKVKKGSHENTAQFVAKTILGTRPQHLFCVNELSAHRPGAMEKSVKLLRPQIGAVTHIGQDHYSSYRDLGSTAAEKGKLVEFLAADGAAVLNADDPYVFEMRKRTKARVITYGLSADAMVRGECVSCAWPEPMSLDVCYAQQKFHIQTRLLGEHWAYAVLAAIAVAIAAGVSMEYAVEAVEAAPPMPYRLSPHETADNITFISDNWKAPLWTVPATLDFMRKAKAARKILVVGSISDTPKSFYDRYKAVIKQALDAADKIIFVGGHAYTALRVGHNRQDRRVMAFGSLLQLNSFLKDYLKAGDLVVLKGEEHNDHLQRLVLARTGDVKCWRKDCGKLRYCTDCRFLYDPSVVSDGLNNYS